MIVDIDNDWIYGFTAKLIVRMIDNKDEPTLKNWETLNIMEQLSLLKTYQEITEGGKE